MSCLNSCHYGVNEDARVGVDTRKKDLTGAGADKVIPELGMPAVEQGKKNVCRYNNKWCRGGKQCYHYTRDPYRECRMCGRYADPSDPRVFPYCGIVCKNEAIRTKKYLYH